MEKTVVVIGATGMLGEPVARCLKEEGFHVRIMTRDRAKALKRFDESFEIAVGDVGDSTSVKNSLEACFGVHISLSGEMEQVGVEHCRSGSLQEGDRADYLCFRYQCI